MPRRDVAIYSPYAGMFYEARGTRAGGAERQTFLLGRALAARGLDVAHVVFRLEEPRRPAGPWPDLVERPRARRSHRGLTLEPAQIWRAMERADAEVYVVRAANAAIGVAAAFCRSADRRLVYASAGNADFADHPTGAPGWRGHVFRWGVRHADALVVQSGDQARMAAKRFPSVSPVHEIPSFVEEVPGPAQPAEGFVWAARLADYKRPMEYVRLARAVPEAHFWMIAVPTAGDTTPELEAELAREARGVPNLEILPGLSHAEMLALSARSVAIVNTSSTEGMPNTFLEGWAAGVPALSLEFDPDGRIAGRGLGVAAKGDFEAFAAGARRLWEGRADRAGMGPAIRAYIRETHGLASVGARWAEVVDAARDR